MLRQDSTKRYNQLAVDLLKKILNRHYLPGSKLPSTRELAKQAGVNPNTMQRALQVLQDEIGSYGNSFLFFTPIFGIFKNL